MEFVRTVMDYLSNTNIIQMEYALIQYGMTTFSCEKTSKLYKCLKQTKWIMLVEMKRVATPRSQLRSSSLSKYHEM
ncbi:hypothetical protein J6590_016927 [Homalodisca vitripennis]|nr:hypothetical protein J6590_016927 [Homalodisca vitripennis]